MGTHFTTAFCTPWVAGSCDPGQASIPRFRVHTTGRASSPRAPVGGKKKRRSSSPGSSKAMSLAGSDRPSARPPTCPERILVRRVRAFAIGAGVVACGMLASRRCCRPACASSSLYARLPCWQHRLSLPDQANTHRRVWPDGMVEACSSLRRRRVRPCFAWVVGRRVLRASTAPSRLPSYRAAPRSSISGASRTAHLARADGAHDHVSVPHGCYSSGPSPRPARSTDDRQGCHRPASSIRAHFVHST